MKGKRSRGRLTRWALLAFTLVALFGTIGVGTASALTPQALILGSTVSGGASSVEATQAALDGFAVTVVNDFQWAAMTASDFRAYQVLVIGDPTCGDTTSPGLAAEANKAVWQPVVMASGGNKVIIGTDPVFHHFSHPGATTLIGQGIAFAGAVAGATGAYVDISCSASYTGTGPFTFLDGLTTHPAGSFTTEYAPCEGAISIVAQSGPTSGLHDTDLSGWSCSVHQSFQAWPSDYTPLAIATDATLKPYCATDVDTGGSVCGEPYILVSGAGVVVKSSISLSPSSATNPVGTSHTVTATILDSTSAPVVGKTVTFTVESGPNAGKTGTGVTDASGQATFTYSDTGGAGTDSISAVFTNDLGAQEKATATKTWSTGGAAPMCVLSATIAGPPKQIQITIGSSTGLGTVVVDTSNNATTPVPAFSVGTTSPIVVTATKLDQIKGSQVAITVTDTAGVVTKCDPIWPGKKAAVHKLATKAPARARHFNRNSR
jgi:Bacterial Ig-like domain (group 1)